MSPIANIAFSDSSVGKESAYNAGDPRLPGSGRSTGERIGYPLRYSGLENSMECMTHGVAKNQTRLSDFHFQMVRSVMYLFLIFLFLPVLGLCCCEWGPLSSCSMQPSLAVEHSL